jgi:hypothetical protein
MIFFHSKNPGNPTNPVNRGRKSYYKYWEKAGEKVKFQLRYIILKVVGFFNEKGASTAPFFTIELQIVSIPFRYFGRQYKYNICTSYKQKHIFQFTVICNALYFFKKINKLYDYQSNYLFYSALLCFFRLFPMQNHFVKSPDIDIIYNCCISIS